MTQVEPIPQDMHTLTPHVICRDGNSAIDWYVLAFGAVELGRIQGPDGKLGHGMLRFGDAQLLVAEECAEQGWLSPLSTQGASVVLHLYVADVDSAFAIAVDAGAEVLMPVEDMFWGDRYGVLRDPFGHHWSLATHVRDVSVEEMKQALAEAG